MKYSLIFGKSVKSVPSELRATSHKLLYKGGFIRQISAGRYAFLPLGFRVWEKIVNIIESEMRKVGSQRLLTPNLHPIALWKATNRDQAFGPLMHIIEDHQGATFAMGATGEGLMTELVRDLNPSYKDLPILIHQFSSKFRDEKRPRGGLLRVREFVMKDAYSFDETEKNSVKTYEKFYNAYLNIAKTFGLDVIPLIADSGAIGGDYGHEFMVKSDVGADSALLCTDCDYSANLEKATGDFKKYPQDKTLKPIKEYKNENVVTCELLAKEMGIPIHITTKTILFKSGKKFIAAMVRGEYDINEAKLKKVLKLDSLELASEKDVKKLTGAKVGFAGPIGLPKETIIIADLTCENRTNFEVGGNKTGIHLYNVNYERDLPTPDFADIRESLEGDLCIKCKNGKLKKIKGIEWGHCFKLDKFYSKPHKGTFTDAKGKQKDFWMGSYGIGIGRSLATIVESHNDEKGIIWPKSVTPFDVHLVELPGAKKTEEIYKKLRDAGIDVIWDDRDVAAGEKFADADLIGIPVRLVVSEKTGDKLEWKNRDSDKTELLTLGLVIKRFS